MKHKQFSYEDIEDIKRYAEGGMSQEEIAYVMECTQQAISYVLKNERQRYKTERWIKRKLMGELGPKTTGNTVTKVGTDDTETVMYESQELPEDYDPTLEMVALFERIEQEIDDENLG